MSAPAPLPRWPLALALILMVSACAHGPRFEPDKRPTVLVLSVGGPEGVAHVGAIAAVKEARLQLGAVVGNSMGALVGALHASRPEADAEKRLWELVAAYKRGTWHQRLRNGVALAGALAAVTAIATDGEWVPTLAAAAGGLAIGAAATDTMERARLVRAMRATFGDVRVERTPIPFVTFFHRPRGGGVELVTVSSGDLAEAVGSSLANPLLFADVKVREGEPLDPGADRASATPVEDACRLFPQANILAINVTGRPAFYSPAMSCPLREVMLPAAGVTAVDLLASGPATRRAIDAGRNATLRALGR